MISTEMTGTAVVLRDFDQLPPGLERASVRALNRGINSARTVMVRAMAKDTGLKSRDINKVLLTRLASDTRPESALSASLQRLPLIVFRATGPIPTRGRGRGVTARLPQSKVYPGAFIARVTGPLPGGIVSPGHTGVFKRAMGQLTRRSAGAWSKNLPIAQLYGPSLGHVFIKYQDQGLARGVEVFEQEFARQSELLASKGQLPNA